MDDEAALAGYQQTTSTEALAFTIPLDKYTGVTRFKATKWRARLHISKKETKLLGLNKGYCTSLGVHDQQDAAIAAVETARVALNMQLANAAQAAKEAMDSALRGGKAAKSSKSPLGKTTAGSEQPMSTEDFTSTIPPIPIPAESLHIPPVQPPQHHPEENSCTENEFVQKWEEESITKHSESLKFLLNEYQSNCLMFGMHASPSMEKTFSHLEQIMQAGDPRPIKVRKLWDLNLSTPVRGMARSNDQAKLRAKNDANVNHLFHIAKLIES